ncbi:MAG TPA: glycosyltransferase family 2 protein [Candidatus Saccharimonadales bacterium]|nr:glycosyltransferase family 2 protein [Candidatus Saccharimonadales bacterium]
MAKPFRVRLFEVIPGLLTWATLSALVYLALFAPLTLAVVVLVYAIYWLLRVFIMTGHLAAGFWRYRQEQKIDWLKKLQAEYPADWQRFYQLVIIPTYKEDISILRHTLEALEQSNYPSEKLLVVVAFEGREKELAPVYAPKLQFEFEHRFGMFLTTSHPADIAGEVRGKGPNITWAGRQVKKNIDSRQLNYTDVITTTIDADNRVDRNYFANLTWHYLVTPDPVHKSFQPLPMYFNNIWAVPAAIKVMALGSTYWQMIQAMRPHYCRNFAAHAQSFAALVKTDFWSVTTVVEDGHQYWRSYFAFKGNHHVVPMFVPIYMDAVQGDNFADTSREQYLQRRRWYWGVSDVPFVFLNSYKNKNIPFFYKWLQLGRLMESHYSLATQSFILLFGWLPVVLHASFTATVFGFHFPIIYRIFLAAAWIGMIANMIIAALMVPPRPGKNSAYIFHTIKEWILAPLLLPLTGIFFSAIPAIDSQTRLLFNKPFTVFNVTKKAAIPGGILVETQTK